MNSVRHSTTLLTLLLVILSLTVSAYASTTKTYYLTGNVVTVNDVTGYHLNSTGNTDVSASVSSRSMDESGYLATSWGWRVYLVDEANDTTELTSDVSALVNRSSAGVGVQSNTWTPPETSLNYGFDSLKLLLYLKINTGDWTLKATFTTSALLYKTLLDEVWTFSLYTNQTQRAIGYFYETNTTAFWNTDTYASVVSGVTFEDGDTFNNQTWQLWSGNFFSFIFAPWTYLLGNMFWGVAMMIPLLGVYMRTRSTLIICVLAIVFGGTGGFFGLILPESGLGILWLFVILGVGGLIFKVSKTWW